MASISPASLSSLLLLADGRLPVGAHANSNGIEWAAARDDFGDIATLEIWVRGRLQTSGTIDAAFAVSAARWFGSADTLRVLDDELAARLVGHRARLVSRQMGRQFARAAKRIWPAAPDTVSDNADGPFAPIALGAVAGSLGHTPGDVAAVSFHHTIASTSTAAIRLLGLDPLEVAAMHVRLAESVGELVSSAHDWAASAPDALPAYSSPLAEVLAEDHGQWSQRLFVA